MSLWLAPGPGLDNARWARRFFLGAGGGWCFVGVLGVSVLAAVRGLRLAGLVRLLLTSVLVPLISGPGPAGVALGWFLRLPLVHSARLGGELVFLDQAHGYAQIKPRLSAKAAKCS